MLKMGTKVGKKTGDIAHQAMREWASIWHRVLGDYSYFPTDSDRQPSHAQIAERAYEIWKSKGCPAGTCEEDWSQAERQLTAQ
jgi:hypothetical protein